MVRFLPPLALLFCVLLPEPAAGAVPSTFHVQGQLRNAAGGPVADGSYMVTFRLYANLADKQAAWSTVVAKLAVSEGAFNHALGSLKKFNIALLSSGKAAWLGAQVGNEPELKRGRVGAAPRCQPRRRCAASRPQGAAGGAGALCPAAKPSESSQSQANAAKASFCSQRTWLFLYGRKVPISSQREKRQRESLKTACISGTVAATNRAYFAP